MWCSEEMPGSSRNKLQTVGEETNQTNTQEKKGGAVDSNTVNTQSQKATHSQQPGGTQQSPGPLSNHSSEYDEF